LFFVSGRRGIPKEKSGRVALEHKSGPQADAAFHPKKHDATRRRVYQFYGVDEKANGKRSVSNHVWEGMLSLIF
jgi:hypothetical protein